MDTHYVLLSSRNKLDGNSNNADFKVSSRQVHMAHSIKAITPVMVRFLDSFTTFPDMVYIEISLFAEGHMATAEEGREYNILCSIPMSNISTGNTVVWEPQDKTLHTIVNHSHDMFNEPVRITLYDENFNKLVANPTNHVDIIVQTILDDDLHV